MTEDDLHRAIEVLNDTAWFDEHCGELRLDSGADATSITVGREGITLHGHETFGTGQEPYAADPTHHIEMLNHEEQTGSEGVVIYEDGPTDDEYPLSLPKHLYFEEDRHFSETVETTRELGEAIECALGVDVPIDDIVSEVLDES